MADSPYQINKRSIAEGIASGRFVVGEALPSEHALTKQFKVSRMTVNRAMRELSNENLIRRVPGVGSFVATAKAQSALVQIHNIADEIASRGHTHTAIVVRLCSVPSQPDMADQFGIKTGDPLFHSEILHFEDGEPLQLEHRLVNPASAPGYLDQDFETITPNQYLMRVAPLQQVEHAVRAVMPSDTHRRLLAIANDEACLLVLRRTWSGNRLASAAELYHPGSRFILTGRFLP